MAAQTSYELNMAKGYIGQLADLNYLETVSAPASSAVVTGNAVFQTGAGTVANLGTTGRFLGLAIRDLARENPLGATGNTDYAATESVSVMRKGYMYCQVASVAATTGLGVNLNIVQATGALTTAAAAAGTVMTCTGITAEELLPAGGGLIKVRVQDDATAIVTV